MPDRLAYTEHRFWSVILGGPAVRLSVADDHGSEYFMIAPRPTRGWAEEKARLLGLIEEAMEAGCAPGEVVVERV